MTGSGVHIKGNVRAAQAAQQQLLRGHRKQEPVHEPRIRRPPRGPDLKKRMPTLNVPTLVLFGTLDRSIPPEMGRVYREMMPNCHLVLVYDAGHALDMDRPDYLPVHDDRDAADGEKHVGLRRDAVEE